MPKPELYVGVDVGRKGCFVGVTSESVPVLKERIPFNDSAINFFELKSLLTTIAATWEPRFVIEEAQIRPGQSGVVAFVRGFGNIEGAIGILGYPLETIKPMTWQKEFFKGLADSITKKSRGIHVASRQWPAFALRFDGQLASTQNDNVADALIMAEWLRRRWARRTARDAPEVAAQLPAAPQAGDHGLDID